MILPTHEGDRFTEYVTKIREAERASRESRRGRHRRNRMLALTGSLTNTPATFNRIKKFIKDSSSILYSPPLAKFDVVSPPEYGDYFLEEEEAARDAFHRLWQDSEAAMTAATIVEAAHWQDTAVAKVYVDRNEPVVDMITDPSDICVAREGLNSWDRQEVLVHFYVVDLPTFSRALSLKYHPESDEFKRIIYEARSQAEPGAESGRSGMTAAQANILLLSASPSMQGNVQDLTDTPYAIPSESEELVRMAEAWIWDDRAHVKCRKCGKARGATLHESERLKGLSFVHEFERGEDYEGDYRVVTMLAATEEILFEPLNPLIAGKHPFHPLCLDVTPGYLWGICPIEPLIPLCEWREESLADIREHLRKSHDPPITATGVQGINDERLLRLKRPGSSIASAMPGGKFEPFLVPLDPDTFSTLEKIDQMIDEAGGIPGRVQGQSDPTVRSGDQMMAGATLASGPSIARADAVENFLNNVATDMLRLQRRISRTPIRKANGEEFLLSHLPSEMVTVMFPGSASPIRQQQLFPKIAFAANQKAIDKPDLIDLLNIPGSEHRRRKARKLAEAEAEKGERMMKAQETKLLADAHKKEADARKL